MNMNTGGDLRKRYWLYVAGWVGLIYITLYAARPACEFLKATTPFALIINVFVLLCAVVVIAAFIRRGRARRPLTYVLLCAVFLSYAGILQGIEHPEEKIHLAEYGFLAYLIFRALHRQGKGVMSYLGAFILAGIFGWIDEGIQYLLPNRYYQAEDVFLNAVSAALGLVTVFVYRREGRISF